MVGVLGALDVGVAASLRRVLDGIPNDRDIHTMNLDLHEGRGDGVAALAGQARQDGAEETLIDRPELLCQARETEGLTGLIRMFHQDRQAPWPATKMDRRQAPAHQPDGSLLLLERPNRATPLST